MTNERTRPGLRSTGDYSIRQIKGIVVHWTGSADKGFDAAAEVRHFNQSEKLVSAHYVVDDHQILQCIPDHEIAFHAGGTRYKPDGDRIRETGLNPNYFTIGFEMCANVDGQYEKTYQNGVELAAHLLQKYRFCVQDLYRHFDLTGKECPALLLDAPKWAKFKRDVNLLLILNAPQVTEESMLAQVSSPMGGLIYSGPGNHFPIIDAYANGAYLQLKYEQGEWYALGNNRWIHYSHVAIQMALSGEVVGTQELNVRSGPSTEFKIIRRLRQGDRVMVLHETDGWLRIGYSEWVYSGFIR